jgi:hypothetical protein
MPPPSTLRHGLTAALCLLSPLLSLAQDSAREQPQRLLHFAVEGSKATYPLAINERGTITGYYLTSAGATSGFVRDEDGQVTPFNVPGSVLTEPVSINTAGEITGFFEPASSTPSFPMAEGFVRSANGTITTFGDTSTFSAQPVAIDAAGEVVGNYPDIAFAGVAFIRSATGSIESFSLSEGASYPTFVTGLNDAGEVVGYSTSDGTIYTMQGFQANIHGPVPSPGNTAATEISVPGSEGTFPTGINAEGTVVGCSFANNVYQDFIRNSDGVLETLTLPGTTPSCLPGFSSYEIFNVNPTSISINSEGTVTGSYLNQQNIPRGFVRFPDGKLATFGDLEATQTLPTGINQRGVITGYDSQGSITRGFILEP